MSALACSNVTPGFSRPMASRKIAPRCWYRLDAGSIGIQKSAAPVTNSKLKSAGVTPTTSRSRPSSFITRPTTPGSAPKRRCHSPWLMTTAPGPPGFSSSGPSKRPNSGFTLSTRKMSPDATTPVICSGASSPLSAALPLV